MSAGKMLHAGNSVRTQT